VLDYFRQNRTKPLTGQLNSGFNILLVNSLFRHNIGWLVLGLLVSLFLPRFCLSQTEADKAKPFEILFLRTKVSFSGSIESKATAEKLANTIISVRPDLKVVNDGLRFDPAVKFPDLELFESLVIELAISTAEGIIELSDNQLVVGGLTDSPVASSALRLRAKPLLGSRSYKDQTCLIPSSDLPDTPILLSTGETRKPFAFKVARVKKKEVITYQPPGFLLQKLAGLIEATKDLSIYLPESERTELPPEVTKVDTPPESPGKEESSRQPDNTMAEAATVFSEALKPNPFQHFGPILFGRNSFILRTGQSEFIPEVAAQLNVPPWDKKAILIQGVVYQSGSSAFAEWLGDRRKSEVVKRLIAAGVSESRFQTETTLSADRIDGGEVRVLVKKPETEEEQKKVEQSDQP